jgi:membrane protease YdiL (CAAX protease family)
LRISVPLAWFLLALGCFTAGLLRQFHDRTPESPLVSPIVGSLLFAAIFLLLLVSAWEWRRGAVSGGGVRLGSLTPLLLMLLIEKWCSLAIYPRVFGWIAPAGAASPYLDAWFRALAGVGLLAVCLLVGRLSRPASRKTWRRARPSRWPAAALATLTVVAGCYACLGSLGWLLGADLSLMMPRAEPLLFWVLGGQALLGFAEELYYRGLLLSELGRLAPRLGLRSAAGRRWTALLFTSALFGLEHFVLGPPWDDSARELVFTVSLGLLLGMLVMVSANLHFAGGVHAWINWLLLGAAPHFGDGSGLPALPPGTYIGVTLILSFTLAFALKRRHRGRLQLEPGGLREH